MLEASVCPGRTRLSACPNKIILYFLLFFGLTGLSLRSPLHALTQMFPCNNYSGASCQSEMRLLWTNNVCCTHCLLSVCLMVRITSIVCIAKRTITSSVRIAQDKQASNAASFGACLMMHKSFPSPVPKAVFFFHPSIQTLPPSSSSLLSPKSCWMTILK